MAGWGIWAFYFLADAINEGVLIFLSKWQIDIFNLTTFFLREREHIIFTNRRNFIKKYFLLQHGYEKLEPLVDQKQTNFWGWPDAKEILEILIFETHCNLNF